MTSDWYVQGAERPRFVADLPSLEVRLGPQPRRVRPRFEAVVDQTVSSVRFRLATGVDTVYVEVAAVEHGVLSVKIGTDPDASPRSQSSWRLIRAQPSVATRAVEVWPDHAIVDASSLRAEIHFDPFHIRFVDEAGALIVEQQDDDNWSTRVPRGAPLGFTDGVSGRVYTDILRARPDEHFFGLGESFTDFDKRGQRAATWSMDCYGVGTGRSYKPLPFIFSTAGYGLLVNSGAAVELDLAAGSASSIGLFVEDDTLEYYVLAGPRPADVVRRYYSLTGPPSLPPLWAFGVWVSTGFLPQTQAGVEAWAAKGAEHGFPFEVLHIDPYWMKKGTWSDLEWDRDAFPDPPAMLAQLKQAGIRTCLWINPYIAVETDTYRYGADHGYFLRTEDGDAWVGQEWGDDVAHPPVAVVDFTNPEATAWWQSRLRRVLEDGVAVIKTDFGEGVPVEVRAFNGARGSDLHNVYPLLYNEAVAEVTEQVHGYRVVWGRSSYIGGQRHAAQWGGDTASTWEGMASTLRGGLSYAMSGYSFWSHDIGGFDGQLSPELFVRWAQFGLMSPLSRMHGTTSRAPWEWEPPVLDSLKDLANLRYRLLPYIWSEAVHAAHGASPLLRPMVFDEPDNPATWGADGCYMLGPSLLVAPVRDEEGHLFAYLPDGEWIEWQSRRVHDGNSYLRHLDDLTDDVPLLIRAGSAIPVWEGRHSPEGDFTEVGLQLWRLGQGATTTTIVHGLSQPSTITVTTVGDGIAVDLQGPLDLIEIEIMAPEVPVGVVTVNGVTWEKARRAGFTFRPENSSLGSGGSRV